MLIGWSRYRDVLAAQMASARDGSSLPGSVSAAAIESSFLLAYKRRSAELACFGAGVCSAEDWWRPVVHQTFLGAGVDERTLNNEVLFESVFDCLWEQFAGQDAWELLPNAHELLVSLDTHRRVRREQVAAHQRGVDGQPLTLFKVGVVSDWDCRLPDLLAAIGIAKYVDFIHPAFDIGFSKPAVEVFDMAREVAGGVSAARTLHIGDSLGRDVRGPLIAGLHAVHLGPVAEDSEAASLLGEFGGTGRLHVCEAGLSGLPKLLGIETIAAPNPPSIS